MLKAWDLLKKMTIENQTRALRAMQLEQKHSREMCRHTFSELASTAEYLRVHRDIDARYLDQMVANYSEPEKVAIHGLLCCKEGDEETRKNIQKAVQNELQRTRNIILSLVGELEPDIIANLPKSPRGRKKKSFLQKLIH